MLITSAASAMAQQHNFDMYPENTDCHTLVLTGDKIINRKIIQSATFRVTENIKISKNYCPQAASFYSCDGKIGHLIAQENDSTFVIYKDMQKNLWDSLLLSDDPITFYQLKIKPHEP